MKHRIFDQAPLVLLVLTWLGFGLLQPRFLTVASLVNLFTQSAATIVVATGMTLVLLTAGVDLSVGAAMFLAAALAGKLALAGVALPLCALVLPATGLVFGTLNALLVVHLRVPAFIVTLAMLSLGRGFALEITQTRAMNLPEAFSFFGRPLPSIAMAAIVVAVAQVTISCTVIGPRLLAFGENASVARLSGLSTTRLTYFAFAACGLCAGVASLLVLGRLGTVSANFGENYEFTAIAAAVLGGTSLLGGRGAIFPGTVVGALLMQMVESGLVMVAADPYFFRVALAGVIFLAVLLNSTGLRARSHPQPPIR